NEDGVEHTARRAGPSVSDAGDHEIRARVKITDGRLVDLVARRALAVAHGDRRAMPRGEPRGDLLENRARVDLGILHEPEAQAMQAGRAWSQGHQRFDRSRRGIET